MSPQQFMQQRLELPRLKSGQELSSNGLEGYTGLFEAQGKLVRVSVVYLNDSAFIFFASTKQAKSFQQFDRRFIETAKSLHRLTPQEVPLAKAKKLKVVTVSGQDSYRNWASSSRITNSAQQQLRLLNGHFPNGELKAGQLAKRVD
jgi:predicted Zn-dependent protease